MAVFVIVFFSRNKSFFDVSRVRCVLGRKLGFSEFFLKFEVVRVFV